jgi:hypothetical protein
MDIYELFDDQSGRGKKKQHKNRGEIDVVSKTAMFLQTYQIVVKTLSVISLNFSCFLTRSHPVKSPIYSC